MILSQKLTANFSTIGQGKHSSKGFALITGVLSRACADVAGTRLVS